MGKINSRQYALILEKLIINSKDEDKALDEFFQLLIKNYQTKLLPEIIKEYNSIADSKKQLKVVSKIELTKDQISQIQGIFGKDSEINNVLDPQLIGGFRIETDSKIYDATVDSQLTKLENQLKSK